MSDKILTTIVCILFFAFSKPILAESKSVLDIKTWSTQNGSKVLYVYTPELPMVDVQVVFDAGSSRDGEQFGLAKLTNEMLSAGTKTMDVDAIAVSFDNVGALYANAVNRDTAVLALRSLTDAKFLDPAIKTFTAVLSEASFPNSEFTRVQKQTLNGLNKQDEEPAVIAVKAFYRSLYGNEPYGHPIAGTVETVNKLNVADLQKFYSRYYTAKNALVTIVGAVNIDKAKNLAEQISSKLPQGEAVAPIAIHAMNNQAVQQHIPFDSTQTHILVGYLGIKQNDPSYFSALVGNNILGGSTMTSRLFEEVREKRGLAYSIYSQFLPLKEKGPFVIELQSRKEEANNAINVVNNTLQNYTTGGPTDAELDHSKKNIVRGFMLKLASNNAIISQLNNIGFYKLPLNYLDTYRDNVNKVTRAQIMDTFKQIAPVGKLITVTVGFNHLNQHVQK